MLNLQSFVVGQNCNIDPKIIPIMVQHENSGQTYTTFRAKNTEQERSGMCTYVGGTTPDGKIIPKQLVTFLGSNPNSNQFTFSLKTDFADTGFIRYRYVIYKVPFRNQWDLSLWRILNSRNRIEVYNSGLITHGNIAYAGIDREVTIPVDNNYTYYSEFSYQYRWAGIWGISKSLKSNSFNIYENCKPTINYSFDNVEVTHGMTISKNAIENFLINVDKPKVDECSGDYFVSVEESDQWMGRKPETQVGKWVNKLSLFGITNVNQNYRFSLKDFYMNNYNKSFVSGKYYRIEVAVGSPFTTKIFLLKVN